jgi:V/A-type H+-transporting ATPase subunit E
MTLESIRNHIIEQAKAEASAVAEETRREADRLIAGAHEEVDREFHSAMERLSVELAAALDQETGRLRAGHRMELLKLKSHILDDIFTRAAGKLLSNEEYWERIREHLEEMAGQEGQILCRAEHRERIGRMIKELNGRLERKVPGLARDPAGIRGGFVFQGRAFDVDVSLDSQLDVFREKVLPEFVARAFPEK